MIFKYFYKADKRKPYPGKETRGIVIMEENLYKIGFRNLEIQLEEKERGEEEGIKEEKIRKEKTKEERIKEEKAREEIGKEKIEEEKKKRKYEILKRYFGYEKFRFGQEKLIDGILQGQDVLGIMPTGAGKSICYQVPALLLSGITLVISPLISLMTDQVKALNQAGIHAAYINSSLTESQVSKALQYASQGRYKIIYIAPERLETDSFLFFAAYSEISMITVDEAHCISQWGQDFRPSYLKIISFINSLPKRPIISAFTATATEAVKKDIVGLLGLYTPQIVITGFDRENLYFEVRQAGKKENQVLDYIVRHSGESGIIYCSTRKNADNLCSFLERMGVDATKYHAGLSKEERKRNQEDFIYDVKPVMVATNAFGMGIDKSNVRYVLHYNMPQSLENYYQEAGRAGRDGQPSECILFYSPQDVIIQEYFIENKGENGEFTLQELEILKEKDRKRLWAMRNYCITKRCLRQYILSYFGESYSQRDCGNCSNCLTEYKEIDVTEIAIDILKCVKECGQRYGINVIVGVLRGENNTKIYAYGLTRLACFGLRREIEEVKLKEIIDEMAAEHYLWITQDKYRLIRLGNKAKEIIEGRNRIIIKLLPASIPIHTIQIHSIQKKNSFETEVTEIIENNRNIKTRMESQEQRNSQFLINGEIRLFDKLKEKRLEIARKESLPPYLVFSDKTLMDMCMQVPSTRKEMLMVTGVGENKYKRYGEIFLAIIKEFHKENN